MKTAVILAGGLSTRMGYDKQLIMYKGHRLIQEQVEKLSEYFDHIVIVRNNELLDQIEFSSSVTFISDIYKEKGPLGGIHSACCYVEGRFYVIACDMPTIDLDYISYMNSFTEDGIITCKGDWIEPFNAFYNSSFLSDLENFLKDGKRNIYQFLKTQNIHYIPENIARKFDQSWQMFKNINTKEDL